MSAEGLEQVSVEDDNGRVLTGVGVTKTSLQETVDSRDTSEPAEKPNETAPPVPDERRKEPRGQKRFDQLTGEREDAKRRAEAAEKERDDLRQRLDAAERQRAVPSADPGRSVQPERPNPVAVSQATATRVKPSEDQIGTTYQSYADYVEDLADWKYEQKEAARDIGALVRQSIEADRANRSFSDSIAQMREKAGKVYPDFDAVLNTGPGVGQMLGPDETSDLARAKLILRLPNAEHVIYAIAKDATLAKDLAGLSDIEFGMRLSAIAPTASVAPLASTAPAVSAIPPSPYQPVGSGSTTTVLPSAELPKRAGYDFDKSGYREKRAAERGVNRRP